jgi:hypothetical protein
MQFQEQIQDTRDDESQDTMRLLDIRIGVNGSMQFPFEVYVRAHTEFRAYTLIGKQLFWGTIDNEGVIVVDGMCTAQSIREITGMAAQWVATGFVYVGASMKNRITALLREMSRGTNPVPGIEDYGEYRLAKRAILYLASILPGAACTLDRHDDRPATVSEYESVYGRTNLIAWAWHGLLLSAQQLGHPYKDTRRRHRTYTTHSATRIGEQDSLAFSVGAQTLLGILRTIVDREGQRLPAFNRVCGDVAGLDSTLDELGAASGWGTRTQFTDRTRLARRLGLLLDRCVSTPVHQYIHARLAVDHLLCRPVFAQTVHAMQQGLSDLVHRYRCVFVNLCRMLVSYEKELILDNASSTDTALPIDIGKVLGRYAVYDTRAGSYTDQAPNRVDRTPGTTYLEHRQRVLRDYAKQLSSSVEKPQAYIDALRLVYTPVFMTSHVGLEACPPESRCLGYTDDTVCGIWPHPQDTDLLDGVDLS